MPDNTTALWSNVSAIKSDIDRHWAGNDVLGGYNLKMEVSSWPISVRPTGDTNVYDYFLVQLQGKAHLVAKGDFQPNAYAIFWGVPQGAELVDSSPDTSNASTSYTASVSTTVGGSFGFMGDAPTGSMSASETISHSTTHNVADLHIINLEDQNAIIFVVERDTDMAHSEAPLLAQLLFKRPHSDATLDVQFTVRAYFTGGDRGDLGGGWTGLDKVISAFNGGEQPSYQVDSASADYDFTANLTPPPSPKA